VGASYSKDGRKSDSSLRLHPSTSGPTYPCGKCFLLLQLEDEAHRVDEEDTAGKRTSSQKVHL
jgi:hypothetical protein